MALADMLLNQIPDEAVKNFALGWMKSRQTGDRSYLKDTPNLLSRVGLLSDEDIAYFRESQGSDYPTIIDRFLSPINESEAYHLAIAINKKLSLSKTIASIPLIEEDKKPVALKALIASQSPTIKGKKQLDVGKANLKDLLTDLLELLENDE